MIANFGRFRLVLIPPFFLVSSFVRTAESLVSLPAAAIVSTHPTGVDLVSMISPPQISSRDQSGFATPWAIAFAVSIELPPPTARRKSAPNSIAFSTPSCAYAIRGFGFTPPNSA